MAAETSADAAVPVTLALLKLNSLFYFQAIHTVCFTMIICCHQCCYQYYFIA